MFSFLSSNSTPGRGSTFQISSLLECTSNKNKALKTIKFSFSAILWNLLWSKFWNHFQAEIIHWIFFEILIFFFLISYLKEIHPVKYYLSRTVELVLPEIQSSKIHINLLWTLNLGAFQSDLANCEENFLLIRTANILYCTKMNPLTNDCLIHFLT